MTHFYRFFYNLPFEYILLHTAGMANFAMRSKFTPNVVHEFIRKTFSRRCLLCVNSYISLHSKLMERKATILRWFTMPLNSLNQFDYSCYRSTAILNGMYVFVCGGGLHCRSHDPFVCRHGSEINNVWRYLQFASPYLYPWCVASCSQYISLYVL